MNARPVASIVSLVPAGTEIAWALGLGSSLVGRSHDCDWPAGARGVPVLTCPRLDATAPSREIHDAVSQARSAGEAGLFRLDVDTLVDLRPDLVLTQATCDVCAISGEAVALALERMENRPQVVALSATSLAGVWRDIHAVGQAASVLPRARSLVSQLQARCDSVSCRVRALRRPDQPPVKVVVLDWLDPPMVAGHWVPEIIGMAGGTDVLGHAGGRSRWIDWPAVFAADPDVLILSPCGFTAERTGIEAVLAPVRDQLLRLRAFREGHVWAIDGHHLLNRPGPRLVDSLESLAQVLDPNHWRFAASTELTRQIGA